MKRNPPDPSDLLAILVIAGLGFVGYEHLKKSGLFGGAGGSTPKPGSTGTTPRPPTGGGGGGGSSTPKPTPAPSGGGGGGGGGTTSGIVELEYAYQEMAVAWNSYSAIANAVNPGQVQGFHDHWTAVDSARQAAGRGAQIDIGTLDMLVQWADWWSGELQRIATAGGGGGGGSW